MLSEIHDTVVLEVDGRDWKSMSEGMLRAPNKTFDNCCLGCSEIQDLMYISISNNKTFGDYCIFQLKTKISLMFSSSDCCYYKT